MPILRILIFIISNFSWPREKISVGKIWRIIKNDYENKIIWRKA
ncbi:MAG: hypothetical protein OP8BY_0710 [Candidatus Saccharicenans subterraneus]|uniref:Uncharacterized protein n=1 Tax=Candidatus Saccharicenans subterraneus TaxID=2508984 RepID=A0A3E2BJZ9_9BACT|nr:MAG: hypothetical protein OP8BY_0710 [Candidatus Saccharicenans subterraneum]